jgi:hypothetical protein
MKKTELFQVKASSCHTFFSFVFNKKTMAFGSLNNSSVTGSTSGGVLSQIIALGAADSHLTADPEITFWRLRVSKCTNAAMESILQTFTGDVRWGSEVVAKINKTGDLLHWIYLVLDLPAISAVSTPSGSNVTSKFPSGMGANECNSCGDDVEMGECSTYTSENLFDDYVDKFSGLDSEIDHCTGLARPYCNWVNSVGHAAISRASFSIGGQIIDSVYNHYLHMWEELSGSPGKRLEEMIGRRETTAALVADSQFARRLYVPLPFYFTQFSGNSLPLISLQFHSVDMHVSLSQLEKMIQVSDVDARVVRCTDGQPITNSDVEAMLDTTYIYLDIQERDKFATGSFSQLITQVQQYATTSTSGNIHAQLNFNHPTIELMWCVQRKCHSDANDTFNYSGVSGRDPVTRARLSLNNLARFDREGTYFRLVQPYEKHTNIPRSFVYNYSFALKPESCQPSGSLNFSRIDNADFEVVLQESLHKEQTALYVFARSFNILRFRDGLGGLLFSNIVLADFGNDIEWA